MMKARPFVRKIFAAHLLGLIFTACTEAPTENKIANPPRIKINGKIALSPGVSPESVYVWLEGTPLATYTDKTGAFALALPASGKVPPFNVTAAFNLYFYLANYKLDFTTVLVQDGQFLYSRGEIGRNGELTATRYLQELLEINTLVQPATVTTSYQGSINVEVSLSAAFDSVVVVFPRSSLEELGGLLLKHLNSGQILVAAPHTNPGRNMVEKIGREPFKYSFAFDFKSDQFPIGQYEIIPYFLIAQDNMPTGLLPSLGQNVEALGPAFLKIPCKRKGGQFLIRDVESQGW